MNSTKLEKINEILANNDFSSLIKEIEQFNFEGMLNFLQSKNIFETNDDFKQKLVNYFCATQFFAKPQMVDFKKNTILMEVCRFIPNQAEWVLKAGSDINAQNQNGHTALLRACSFQPKLIPMLVHSGANVNAQTYDGDTPLMLIALHCSNPEPYIQLLVENGADLDIKNFKEQTCIDVAHGANNIKAYNLLQRYQEKQMIKSAVQDKNYKNPNKNKTL